MYLINHKHLSSDIFGNNVLLELNVGVRQRFKINHRHISPWDRQYDPNLVAVENTRGLSSLQMVATIWYEMNHVILAQIL